MLFHQTYGQGTRSTLLLHGFLGSGRNLATVARHYLARDSNLQLVLPDLTGHGMSKALAKGADLAAVAQDVVALAEHLALPKPWHIIGHSLGGRVALLVRQLRPEAVEQVVLIDIPPGVLTGLKGEMQLALELLLLAKETVLRREDMKAFFLDGGLSLGLTDWLLMNLQRQDAGYSWRIDRQALAALQHQQRSLNLWPQVEAYASSTQCIVGGASTFVSAQDIARLQKAQIRVDVIPQAGHFVHVDKLPELLALLP